jgi:transposase-like protein
VAVSVRAIESHGDTVEFWFSERRNLTSAKRFRCKALKRHGRPERIVIDGSQTSREAILSCDTTDRLQDRSRRKLKLIRIRQSSYLNSRIEQDHRAIKRRVRPMLCFKSEVSARVILGGIEMVHMMRKGQARYAQFEPITCGAIRGARSMSASESSSAVFTLFRVRDATSQRPAGGPQ